MVRANIFQFELATGMLYADQAGIEQAETSNAPRNLVQLLELGRLALLYPAEESRQTTGAADGEIVPLNEVLQSKNNIGASDYERLDVSQWTRDDYIEYGRWLDSITKDPQQEKSSLTERIITRAYHLGIGPSRRHISDKDLYPKLSSYYRALGIQPKHEVHKYDSWSDQQLADYAESVFMDLQSESAERAGQPPSLAREVERRAQQGFGPSMSIFKRDGGSVMRFMALNGYADVRNMGPQDYVHLGVQFMAANNGKLPTREAIDFLSQSRRMPTSRAVRSKFRWTDYLEQVQAAYEKPGFYDLKEKLPIIKQELKDGTLPHAAISDVTEEEALKHALNRRAKWLLVNELLPELDAEHKLAITRGINLFFEALIRTRGNFSDADIEEVAARLDITEDLWPSRRKPRPYMRYLRVPQELLE